MHYVLSLSGGMDSATVLAKLLQDGHSVDCFYFAYGSKHEEFECEMASRLIGYYFMNYRVATFSFIRLPFIKKEFRSDLLKGQGEIPEGHFEDESMKDTVVPCRNMIFLSILAGLAESRKAEGIALGIHQGDHAIYPDCRPLFFDQMAAVIQTATDGKVGTIAPFLHTDKHGILAWGLEHKVPYHLTRTCYKDQPLSCGRCGSCVERLEAFSSMGIKDPITYEEREDGI